MFNLQGSEIIVILLLALVILGPEKLPDAIRKFTQTYGELKKMGNGFQSELKSSLEEPMREMRETADLVQRAADPKRIAEEAENEARLRAEADAAAFNGSADVPVDPAALAVMDPVAAAGDAADETEETDDADGAADASGTAVGATSHINGAPIVAKPANGESVKKVNQIALSMARGPIDPKPEVEPIPLTAPPEGAASMLAPPPIGAAVPDAPPPPPSTTPPSSSTTALVPEGAETGGP